MRQSQKGFTLIEIVVVIALMVLLLGGMSSLFISHYKIYNYQNALIKASGSARTTMNEVSKDALEAYRVVVSQNINGTSYNSGATTVIFQIPSFDSSGTAVVNTYDYVAYSLNGKALTQDYQAGAGSVKTTSTKVLSNSVSALSFTYDNASFPSVKKVTVNLTTSETDRGETITQHLIEQYKLRNY